ncbi:hypothetical protein [Pseudonocardia sp. H11422]|uniref:hypothetical protein n=1 Tax=Pseudonocardia sp. H11422 TaxID=2835866 RepID=UPI002027B52E|nr:hypothetical protein [Pseudonocardia sp. H11422]
MSPATTSPADRRAQAAAAVEKLGMQRSEHLELDVRCSRSHHVAAVYRTDRGLVYATITGPHAHGSRDRIDTRHHGGPRGRPYLDLLNTANVPEADDALPAWCECGPRQLSRSELRSAVAARRRHIILN